MELKPKIRGGVEALPARAQGRDLILLRDRMGLSEELALPREWAGLLALLDGRHSVRDIQVSLMRQQGLGLIPLEEIQRILNRLDEGFFLDSERFRIRYREVSEKFRAETVRPPAHAGSAYPARYEELNQTLQRLFEAISSPGDEEERERPLALILPHIDLHRGGECYAWGYKALRGFPEIRLFVILGTCHLPMEKPFALTEKIFETPLGRTPSDSQLVREVVRCSGLDLYSDELVHRTEHTIEFQVVFLQYLVGVDSRFRIVPVLCNGFHRMMEERILPTADPEYSAALRGLQEVLRGIAEPFCLIASADLSHLGPQFGDPRAILPGDLPGIRTEDQTMLEPVLKGNADGFYRHILGEADRRRICGLPPIYTLLKLVGPCQGRLLHYQQAHHPHATVTFASVGFWPRA